jgi:hypothetical protein
MKKATLLLFGAVFLAVLVAALSAPPSAYAHSTYYTDQYCSACHGSSPDTCNGCHAHGVHSNNNKDDLNLTASTDKTTYQPGETMSVTINGGYRSGWVRTILYDQTGTEVDRSTGPSGKGGGESFPVTLTAAAPDTPGTYTFSASWYGNQFDASGAFFGPDWRPDPGNPNHGEEVVSTNSFVVQSAAPPPAPDITVTDSVAPATDLAIDFGSVFEGSSAEQTVTVTNNGSADLVMGPMAQSDILEAPFSLSADTCSGATLSPGATCSISALFAPAVAGSYTDTFDIPSNDPDENPVVFSLSGAATSVPVADISVTDSVAPATDLSVDFGSVSSGTSVTETVTVTNVGSADLTLGALGTANPLQAPFALGADTCSGKVLSPQTSCTVDVSFLPSTVDTFSDAFDIPSDDPDENPVTVSVSGTGTAIPVADITVTDSVAPATDLTLGFGSVSSGAFVTETVTVTNDGNADLVLGTVAQADPLQGPFRLGADQCSGTTLQPAGTCTVSVAFEPVNEGTFSDSFDIPSNDPDENPITVSVSGTGTVQAVADITVTDSAEPPDDHAVTFGSLTEGRSAEQVVTVRNDGVGDLLVGSIGAYFLKEPFSVAEDACSGLSLAQGEECTVTVSFSPQSGQCTVDSSAGDGGSNGCSYSGSFDIPSNDPDEQTVTVAVSGIGVPGTTNNPPGKVRLLYPSDRQEGLETELEFRWERCDDPDGDDVGYTLYISKDPTFMGAESTRTVQVASAGAGTLLAGSGIGFILVGIAMAGGLSRRRRLLALAFLLLLAGFLFMACSGDGSGSVPATPDSSVQTQQVSGLDPGSTYYWKVAAADGQGGVSESDVWTFTTR